MTDLDRAIKLADAADKLGLEYFRRSGLKVQTKPDKSPVTEADEAIEAALSAIVRDEFGDAYVGEEGTREQSVSGRSWVVDPIDATRNFMRGMPVWGTLICLSDSQGAVAAVVTAPALGRRWWAVRGQGAWTRDVDGTERQLHVSGVSELSDAYIAYGSVLHWNKVAVGVQRVLELFQDAWRHRGMGDFWAHMMVAEGACDACIEPDLKEWDIAAPALIIREAGGAVWFADSGSLEPGAPRAVITSNGLVECDIKQKLGY